jgi:hypothetical protein
VGITFWSIGFFLDTIKPWFLTEGKFATVLIIPSSWGSQLGGYLPASNIPSYFSSNFFNRSFSSSSSFRFFPLSPFL